MTSIDELKKELDKISEERGILAPKLGVEMVSKYAGIYVWHEDKILLDKRYGMNYRVLYHEFCHHLQFLKAPGTNAMEKATNAFAGQELPHSKRPHEIEAEEFARREYRMRHGQVRCFECGQETACYKVIINVDGIDHDRLFLCGACKERFSNMSTGAKKEKLKTKGDATLSIEYEKLW